MTPNQRMVASWVAIGALLVALAYTCWLWATLSPSGVVNDPVSANPELRLGWKVALWLIELGTAIKTIFAILLTVMAAGIAAAGELYKHKWQIALIAVLCITGAGMCALLMVGMNDTDVLGTLAFYSGFGTNAELKGAANTFFIALIGWFLGFLAAQLGIRALPEKVIKKIFGG